MSNSWFIIANPASGNQNFLVLWNEILEVLNLKKIAFEFAFTEYAKHEIELVQNAIEQGYRNIISVGGDGTLHHIVNGIMMQKYVETSAITVAVIPIGTGNDWVKSYAIPKNIEKAITIICQKKVALQDIGVLELEGKDISYFNNIAGLGYDGYIINKLNKLKRFGSIAYLISGLWGLLFYKKTQFKIVFNAIQIEYKCLMVLFGICQFSGGGMQFTKNSNPSNGLLDITIAKNLNLYDLLININKLYNGNIVYHKKVEHHKTKQITIIPQASNPFIQADGELIGRGKVSVGIIEKAIQFVINRPYNAKKALEA